MPSLDRPCKGLGVSFVDGFPNTRHGHWEKTQGTWGGFIEQLRGGTWELKLSDVPGLQVQAEQRPQ